MAATVPTMNADTRTGAPNTRCNTRGYDTRLTNSFADAFRAESAELSAGDAAPGHLRDAVESNRVTEAPTTSLHEHHPVHIKEVGR